MKPFPEPIATHVDPNVLFADLADVARNALDLVAEQERQIRGLTEARAHLRQALAVLEVDGIRGRPRRG